MLSANQFRLLFLIIRHQKTIFRATGWQLRDYSEDWIPPKPRRTNGSGYKSDTPDIDLFLVDLHLKLVQSLDEVSVRLKIARVASILKDKGKITKRTLPIELSDDDISSWARRKTMTRVEAVLLSLGYLLRDDIKDSFERLIFDRRDRGNFTTNLEFFPLIEAFLERDEALGSSDVFEGEHMIYRNRKASSVKIFEWFSQMDYLLPEGLLSSIQKYHANALLEVPSKEVLDRDGDIESANPKTLASLYTMIHAMAATRPYLFKTGSTAAQSRIETAILDLGLNMSPKTIRKHLEEAALAVQEIKEKDQ